MNGSMDDRYLSVGLGAMATAGPNGNAAHFGAAVLAAWWLQRDQGLGEEAAQAMTEQVDRLIDSSGALFAVQHRGVVSQTGCETLIDRLVGRLDGVWAIGHDVIFTALAVRTLNYAPELGTDAVLDGLGAVIDWCHGEPLRSVDVGVIGDVKGGVDVRDASADELADMLPRWEHRGAARLALDTMTGFEHIYWGLHQGHVGHVMDHAHALVTLDRLGYRQTATEGRIGLLTHAAALRRAWHISFDFPKVDRSINADPRTVDYWKLDHEWNRWAFGHTFKYPYAFLDLAQEAADAVVVDAARRVLGMLI